MRITTYPSEDRDKYSEQRFGQWTDTELADSIEETLEENAKRIRELRQHHQLIGSYIYEIERRHKNEQRRVLHDLKSGLQADPA